MSSGFLGTSTKGATQLSSAKQRGRNAGMQCWKAGVSLGLFLSLQPVTVAVAQQQPDELRKEIEAIKESLKAIQKDIQDIKALVSRQAPPPSGLNVVLDLASNPVKGERTAKLTLVEFSDYQ